MTPAPSSFSYSINGTLPDVICGGLGAGGGADGDGSCQYVANCVEKEDIVSPISIT